MLAQEAFDSSTDRTWGKVYEPKLVRLSGLTPGRWGYVSVSVSVVGRWVGVYLCICMYAYVYVNTYVGV
jgi:hypothetical protein